MKENTITIDFEDKKIQEILNVFIARSSNGYYMCKGI